MEKGFLNAFPKILCLFGFVLILDCTDNRSTFAGKNPALSSRSSNSGNANEENLPFVPAFRASTEIRTSLSKRDIWAVTRTGLVKHFGLKDPAAELNGNNDEYESKGQWQLAGGDSGHRTFVSEVGLIVGKTGVHMFRVDDDTPGGTVSPIWSAASPEGGSRLCTTSFKADGKTWIGGGYNRSDGRRIFVRILVDKTKPQKLDLATVQEFDAGGSDSWGYSCFTDQGRNIFWSAHGNEIHGFDLNAKTEVAASSAPNFSFAGAELDKLNLSLTQRRSYSIAGDNSGNLLNGSGMYTYAYDRVSKVVFGTTGDNITVTKAECFSSKADCALNAQHWIFDASATPMGPLSSFNDGRVVGMQRSSGNIYVVGLKNLQDPSQGINVRLVGNVPGDPYMYTDYTGATLYAQDVERTIALASVSGFTPEKKIKVLRAKWTASSGTKEEWKGLKLQVRCYKESEKSSKPAYAEIAAVEDAGVEFDVAVGGCKAAVYDYIDVRVGPNGRDSDYSRTNAIAFAASQ